MQTRINQASGYVSSKAKEFTNQLIQADVPNYVMSGSASFLLESTSILAQIEGADFASWMLMAGALGFGALAVNQYGTSNSFELMRSNGMALFNFARGNQATEIKQKNETTQMMKKD